MKSPLHNPPKLLLHACCGPCSMEPVRVTRESGIEPVIYFANSNIHPSEEYKRRLDTLTSWARKESLEVVEGPYDPQTWEERVGVIGEHARLRYGTLTRPSRTSPLPMHRESTGDDADAPSERTAAIETDETIEAARRARCRACYRLRFEDAARYAAEHDIDAIGTTLSVSPYQHTDIIREELERAADRAGVAARFVDYRPLYDAATKRSREEGMYRQNYCACRFSEDEARAEREERKRARKEAKEAEAASRAEERAAEEAARAINRAQKAAYASKQARKRAVLRQLREGTSNPSAAPEDATDQMPSQTNPRRSSTLG